LFPQLGLHFTTTNNLYLNSRYCRLYFGQSLEEHIKSFSRSQHGYEHKDRRVKIPTQAFAYILLSPLEIKSFQFNSIIDRLDLRKGNTGLSGKFVTNRV
jgi:hypothetical protein